MMYMIYSIGQVAQKVKINKETIRYYEKIGLLEVDLCQYSRHIFLVFLSRFCNKIFIILWSHITNSAMNSFSVIPTFNILKY